MTIPNFMPILSRGSHNDPSEGACIMEYASFLAGEKWTDLPTCTNYQLAKAAQYVNDGLDDDTERQRLLPLLPRLMGTGRNTSAIEWAIAKAAADFTAYLIGHRDETVHRNAEDVQTALAAGAYPSHVISSAEIALELAEEDTVAFLSALIDAYDKAVGRTAPATVTEDDLRRCAELTGASR